MQFVPHPQQTRSLGAPIGWDHSKVHCGSLSISDKMISGYRVMESYWRPEGREAINILFGAPIALAIYSQTHPPVSLALANVVLSRTELRHAYEGAVLQLMTQMEADGFRLMAQPDTKSVRVKDLQA